MDFTWYIIGGEMKLKHLFLIFLLVIPASAIENIHPDGIYGGEQGEIRHISKYYENVNFQGGKFFDGYRLFSPNTSAKSPTYEDVISFLTNDTTEELLYEPDIFTCGNFSHSIYKNAQVYGIKCGFTVVHFEDGTSHAINSFRTVDKGLMFTQSQGGRNVGGDDLIINVKPGGKMTAQNIDYSTPPRTIYKSNITKIVIYS